MLVGTPRPQWLVKPRLPEADLVTPLGRSRVPVPWSFPSRECGFSASYALGFGGRQRPRARDQRSPRGHPCSCKEMVSVARHASPSSAAGVLPELAWYSRHTGRASPFLDSPREEPNHNRLASCLAEESLSYCKRGSGAAPSGVSPLSSEEEVHRQAGADDAPAPHPTRSSSRPPSKWQLERLPREGG